MGKTRGVHETTPEIRNRMVGMYEAGLGLREIASAVNCSQRTVKRWLNRFDKEGNVETRERCGRKRATTQDQDEAIIRLATQTPITAAKAVLPALGLQCSVDTVRERLHKAGIHNWNLSRKHIRKIPIAISDDSDIQQPVWRPTGTQLGKKKLTKQAKTSHSQSKKKTTSQKIKSKKSSNNDRASQETVEQNSEEQQSFSYSSQVPRVQEQPQMNEIPPLSQPLPPPPLPPPLPHPSISIDSSQYSHSLNPIPQPQPFYQHHPGLTVTQSWALDLVQSAHPYTQNLHQPIHHEHHSYLHNNNEVQHLQAPENQMQPEVHPLQNFSQQKITSHEIQHQVVSEIPREKLNQSQCTTSTRSSENCSNSNSNCSDENSQNLSGSDEADNDNCDLSKTKRTKRLKKKKGGKVKGTLETSVEIRNRMIGMSEAGLSTLSIALAINRSERTVKRWLDRWHREGNVQTKERKGRRRITTKEQDDAIIAMATQQPLTAAKHVAPALGLKCSVDTIRERLHKAGIYSWKLGQKQGEGNAVHTVHLWQPSGNRSSKIKTSGSKKKKSSSKKRSPTNSDNAKKLNKKQPKKMSPSKIVEPTNLTPEKTDEQFQNQSQSPPVLQTTRKLSDSAPLVQTQVPVNLMPSQSLQPLVMQPRPDCRLAFSAVVPAMPSQLSNIVPTYSSCMMGATSHTEHMEQSDPMNYEPYIWSF